tara:strand:- start:1788 stop:1976 length:189 start_codon:yes stop_codon:yes gene_type:complete
MKMNEFIYDDLAPYSVNFNRWCHANAVERELYKEDKMPFEEAERTFRKMWGFKQLQEQVFIN